MSNNVMDTFRRLRLLVIKQGMERQSLFGAKIVQNAPSAFVLAKQELGWTKGDGGNQKVYAAFCEAFDFPTNPEMKQAG